MKNRRSSALPRSATSQVTVILGLMGYFSAIMLLYRSGTPRVHATAFAMAATALPMILHELFALKTYRRPSAGLIGFGSDLKMRLNPSRTMLKLWGFCGTLAALSTVYWLLPEYDRDLYDPFWQACRVYTPVLLLLVVPYFLLVDACMKNPADGYLQAGYLFTGQFGRLDSTAIKSHFLGWTIKGFFLPLMFVYLSGNVAFIIQYPPSNALDSFPALVSYVGRLSLGLDLAFVSIGYVLTIRIIDAHIRSPNPFLGAWVVTLVMYVPFFSIIGKRYLDYKDGIGWLEMFQAEWGVGVFVWGMAIMAAKLCWAWTNVSFGVRFSNLTHRGILTNGPYRWMRHPSYVFKNIGWWLLAVPFYSLEGPVEAVRLSLLLLAINAIYFLRAKAEEKHLSQDPTYVAYALWVEQHGKFRCLGRLLPFLRYSPPERTSARI